MLCKKFIFGFLLITCLVKQGMAQDECELVLVQATDEFNAGHLSGIPTMLKDCLEKNQNREWRQRAYLLLAETYLLLEDPMGAEVSYLNVLRANPEFLTDQTRDPIDLVYLAGKFTATPIFSFHAYAGSNISPVRVIHDVRIGGEAYTKEDYSVRLGWQAGAGFDFNYNDFLSASAGLSFSQMSFKHTTSDLFGVGKDITEFVDRQSWAILPVSVKYSNTTGKLRWYGYLGYSLNFLFANNSDVIVTNRDTRIGGEATGDLSIFENSRSNIDMIQNRARVNSAVFAGGGLKYKYKLDYFYVDLRYSLGLKNVVDPGKRFNSVTEGLPYPYVDDDFRLDNLAVSIGYIRPFYKPRKLKKSRTKSVLRKIKKEDEAR